ncbi:MAG: glycosyltransferase family 2 protein, partial [Pseudomonadota bacterium]
WLAFLDSDDQWLPHKLEVQVEKLQGQPSIRVCHTEEIWIRNGRRVNPAGKHAKQGGWIFRSCLPLCAMSPSSILIHRAVFDSVGLFDERLPACEDYDLWLRITARYPVLFVDEPLIVKYGGHADQLSRKHWGMDRFRIRALEKVLIAGGLAPECERAARDMLVGKARIYLEGARKRGKQDEVRHYEALCQRHSETQMNVPKTSHG